jgi:hypothetical protein
MQSQLPVAAQRDEVLFRIIPGLTAKFLVVTPSLTSTTLLTPPADEPTRHRTRCRRLSYAVGYSRRRGDRRGAAVSRCLLAKAFKKRLPLLFGQKFEEPWHRVEQHLRSSRVHGVPSKRHTCVSPLSFEIGLAARTRLLRAESERITRERRRTRMRAQGGAFTSRQAHLNER